MTHTPGPWTYHREPTLNRFVVRANFADQTNIATSYGAGLKSYEHEANARLIAAAPDTLQMLKNMVEGVVTAREAAHWSVEQKQAWLNGLVDAARDVIAEVEGRK